MLNEDLLSPKDVEINKLKIAIQRFKEYDKERKEYYKKSLQELGELKSYVQELEETGTPEDKSKNQLKKQVAFYKDLYNHQVFINHTLQKQDNLIPELIQLNFYKEHYLNLSKSNNELKEELKKKQKRIKELEKEISSLVYELHNTTPKEE